MAFDDLGSSSGIGAERKYEISWSTYENGGGLAPLPNAFSTKVPLDAGGAEYLAASVLCAGSSEPPCPGPVTAYLRRKRASVEVVGIDR